MTDEQRFCACEYDWTDGTGICQECKLPRVASPPVAEPAPQTFEEWWHTEGDSLKWVEEPFKTFARFGWNAAKASSPRMINKKIVIPEGMLAAAIEVSLSNKLKIEAALREALLWLSENPIVPTEEQIDRALDPAAPWQGSVARCAAIEWQRHMFIAPSEQPQ